MLRPDVKLKSMMRTGPVILDAHATLSEASSALMARPEESRFDPFVVTMEDRFYGISTVDLVLRGMNSFLRRDNEACLEAQHALLQWQPGERWEPGNIPSASVQKYSRTAESREIATLDFSRYVSPLSGPGGDFSQCYDFSNQSQLFMLFDVCGKGLKASSMVSIIGTTLHSALRYESATGESDNTRVRKLLEKLNAITYELSPAEMYATGIALLAMANTSCFSLRRDLFSAASFEAFKAQWPHEMQQPCDIRVLAAVNNTSSSAAERRRHPQRSSLTTRSSSQCDHGGHLQEYLRLLHHHLCPARQRLCPLIRIARRPTAGARHATLGYGIVVTPPCSQPLWQASPPVSLWQASPSPPVSLWQVSLPVLQLVLVAPASSPSPVVSSAPAAPTLLILHSYRVTLREPAPHETMASMVIPSHTPIAVGPTSLTTGRFAVPGGFRTSAHRGVCGATQSSLLSTGLHGTPASPQDQ